MLSLNGLNFEGYDAALDKLKVYWVTSASKAPMAEVTESQKQTLDSIRQRDDNPNSPPAGALRRDERRCSR